MTQAKCFSCKRPLEVGTPMEQLLKDRFPVFCSVACSTIFPDNGTDLFEARFNEFKNQLK